MNGAWELSNTESQNGQARDETTSLTPELGAALDVCSAGKSMGGQTGWARAPFPWSGGLQRSDLRFRCGAALHLTFKIRLVLLTSPQTCNSCHLRSIVPACFPYPPLAPHLSPPASPHGQIAPGGSLRASEGQTSGRHDKRPQGTGV